MEKLRTGIIGCGKVGDFHAKVYAELPQSELSLSVMQTARVRRPLRHAMV